jgi:hypothetical protein
MKINKLPSLEYLKECFELDPTSPSYLKWKKDRPLNHFNSTQSHKAWKNKTRNSQINSLDKDNYYIVFSNTFFNKKIRYKVHRIVYAISNSEDCLNDSCIDHIDGNRLNNNPKNLRTATVSQNLLNRGKQKNNSTGHKNITFSKRRKKYICKIQIRRKQIHIGEFDTLEEAIEKRDIEGKKLVGEFFKI